MDLPELDPCEFLDYRDFLAELYKVRKAAKPWYSYKALGDKVGMDASLLAKVTLKSRHIAEDSIARFCTACNLEGRTADYFAAMVHFSKSKEDSEAKEWFERMLSLRITQSRRIDGDSYAFYQRWHHTAIRAALDYFPYDGSNPEALGRHLLPNIPTEQVLESIALLEALQLIANDADGFYRPTEQGITTGSGWKSVAVHTFQSESLRLALEGLDRIPKSQRNYSTLTMSLTEEDFEEVKERVKDFRQQLVKFIHSRGSGDRVYQMNMQLLPLTECRRPQ